jgi:hypothetical protein
MIGIGEIDWRQDGLEHLRILELMSLKEEASFEGCLVARSKRAGCEMLAQAILDIAVKQCSDLSSA